MILYISHYKFDKLHNHCLFNSQKGSFTTPPGIGALLDINQISTISTISNLETVMRIHLTFVKPPSAFAAWRWTSSLVLWKTSEYRTTTTGRSIIKNVAWRADQITAHSLLIKSIISCEWFCTGITHSVKDAQHSFSNRDVCLKVHEFRLYSVMSFVF